MQAQDVNNAPIFSGVSHTAPSTEFEFREAENKIFSALSSGMSFVGKAQIATGFALFFIAVVHGWMGGRPALVSSVPMALTGAMLLVSGWWVRQAAVPVAAIVNTSGSDIQNLMQAMSTMAGMYALQRSYFIAVGVVAVIAVAGALLFAPFG
jgi:hypothetical protein